MAETSVYQQGLWQIQGFYIGLMGADWNEDADVNRAIAKQGLHFLIGNLPGRANFLHNE